MNAGAYIVLVLYSLPSMLAAFVLHELAHGAVASRLGDRSARSQGRMSLDPRRQVDPLGFALMLMVGLGYARPVQFSVMYIRTGLQRAAVAVAGPLMNLAFAIACALALHVELTVGGVDPAGFYVLASHSAQAILFFLLLQGFFVNVILFVINILPIPGLDGFVVAEGLLGRTFPDVFTWMQRNRGIVWAVAVLLLFVLPQLSGGSVNILGSFITRVDGAIYDHFVGAAQPQPPYGLPSVLWLFQ